MPYKIAVTSSDGNSIDLHLNEAERFLILRVDETTGEAAEEPPRPFSAVHPAADETACAARGGCCDSRRFSRLAALLADCRYLLTQKIGRKPYAVLQAQGVTALEVSGDLSAAVQALHRYVLRYQKLERARSGL